MHISKNVYGNVLAAGNTLQQTLRPCKLPRQAKTMVGGLVVPYMGAFPKSEC
jgi:hypothetical protein